MNYRLWLFNINEIEKLVQSSSIIDKLKFFSIIRNYKRKVKKIMIYELIN